MRKGSTDCFSSMMGWLAVVRYTRTHCIPMSAELRVEVLMKEAPARYCNDRHTFNVFFVCLLYMGRFSVSIDF